MITRVKFQNFKALRNVQIAFESRLTVIVGPNGSGKTSVLRAVALLGEVAAGRQVTDVFTGDNSIEYTRSRENSEPQILEVVSQFEDNTEFIVRVVETNRPAGKTRNRNLGSDIVLVRKGIASSLSTVKIPENELQNAVLLQLDPKKIAAASVIGQLPPITGPDGQGTASTLAYLDRLQRGKFKQAVDALKRVIRNLTDLRIDYENTGNGVRDALLFDFQGVPGVRAGLASTGTLLLAGLLSVIYGPTSPNVILLDDLDYALHPKGQMELIDILHDVLVAFPQLQIIATSHSPYILDKLSPNEVRVMALNDDGSAVCARLEDHPKYPMWKDSMSPGEFWTHAGEDWVKQLTPQTVAQ
ncbi:atpase : Uncharacterized protein OS=Sorangium cellulosum So0157-2 GN=SCE1572_17170 PE=4 SV=1: AAA_21 [Gemmataceae bacterium]|nr:atpase : Uncharacterized protein OS=Sorangium cellulosum So0157-2 GN=SCE1572_17170 PE=4 SV=1: AAA_21 [Gemmataceae bacterium]VTT99247.1 atpase : Uncharacterized protein OS=Sorangium cellulosum So0157-2 GN=SCE1572_17170 PE=4 SV=1: AAA_21 [Gemmataceae bacterium]